MSERYGAPGELKEVLEGLEDYVREEIDNARAELQQRELVNSHDPRYNTGRIEALRDVLDYLGVSDQQSCGGAASGDGATDVRQW